MWVGEQFLELKDIWRQYTRRTCGTARTRRRRRCFAPDRCRATTRTHWYRFAKQRLHWTLPSLSTGKQCQRWRDLMPLMTWQRRAFGSERR